MNRAVLVFVVLLSAAQVSVAASIKGDATSVEIAPGVHMPKLNLGTCCGSLPEVGIPAWFKAGGVGIDTAWDYHDETTIAEQLKASGKKRSDYFITTKVPAGVGALNGNSTDCAADPGVALRYIRDNLRQLGLEYVDLVLLHGPCRFASAAAAVTDPTAADNALWRGLQQARDLGLTRAIGVSNYNATELAALRGATPAVNQCQMSVGTANTTLPMPRVAHDDATLAYCKAKGIAYEAWRVLGGCPMDDPRVASIAQAHNRSAAQICLRWVLQRGAIVASGTGGDAAKAAEYAAEDLDTLAFALSEDEMGQLSAVSPQPQH